MTVESSEASVSDVKPLNQNSQSVKRDPSKKTILSFSIKACELQNENSDVYDYFQIGYANVSTNGYRKSRLRSFKRVALSAEDYEIGMETGYVQYMKKCQELHTSPVGTVLQALEKQAQHENEMNQENTNNTSQSDIKKTKQPNLSRVNSSTRNPNGNTDDDHELSTMNLGHYGIGNDGAIALSEIFTVNHSFLKVLLNNNDIYNSGAMRICDAINSNNKTTVSILDLSFNKLDITHDIKHCNIDTGSEFSLSAIHMEIAGFGKGFDINATTGRGVQTSNLQKIDEAAKDQDDNSSDDSEKLDIQPSFAVSLQNLLSHNSTLISLNLTSCNLKDDDMKYICTGLAANTRLQDLNVSKNDITDVSCSYMTFMLQENVTLLNLDLSWNKITSNGTLQLMAGVQENTGLKSLNIAWCGIDDEPRCANLISSFVETHDYIESLDISNNFLGDICGQSLINHLQNDSSNLKKIDISNNPFGAKSHKLTIELDNALTNSSINEKKFDGTEIAYL